MFDRTGARYRNHTGVRFLSSPVLPDLDLREQNEWLPSDLLDEITRDPAFREIAKAFACAKYLDMDLFDAAVIRTAIESGRRRYTESGAHPHQPRPRRGIHEPIIYYVSRGELVKIGLSRNMVARYGILGMPDILAIERGDIKVERARHKFFADLHVQGEWFRNVDPLTSYIKAVAETFVADFGTDLPTWFEHLREGSRG